MKLLNNWAYWNSSEVIYTIHTDLFPDVCTETLLWFFLCFSRSNRVIKMCIIIAQGSHIADIGFSQSRIQTMKIITDECEQTVSQQGDIQLEHTMAISASAAYSLAIWSEELHRGRSNNFVANISIQLDSNNSIFVTNSAVLYGNVVKVNHYLSKILVNNCWRIAKYWDLKLLFTCNELNNYYFFWYFYFITFLFRLFQVKSFSKISVK